MTVQELNRTRLAIHAAGKAAESVNFALTTESYVASELPDPLLEYALTLSRKLSEALWVLECDLAERISAQIKLDKEFL